MIMEEIQSWWEVPSIAHFCYVFRSAFNLLFFEITELESALLSIQNPDMNISLEQLIIKLLQGCFDDESINEANWEEKLHELFNDNLENDENPFDSNTSFYDLTPRSKVELLFKLCELRLDVESALEEIKNIPPEEMQAKCMGKDKENNIYWYFCDERLYKENPSSSKSKQLLDIKNGKDHKKQITGRQKRSKMILDIDKSWTVACFNINDWEKLMQKFSKSKSTNEKELSIAIKNHLPVLQERIAEKDRLLRKRYIELAPKRTSSRISKVQEKKRMEEMKAAEEARLAKIEAEKERARKESLMLKMQKESRQRRAEERHKAIEERAERAKLRELARNEDSDESDEEGDIDKSLSMQNKKQIIKNNKNHLQGSESESEESDSTRKFSNIQSSNIKKINYIPVASQSVNRQCDQSYSCYQQPSNSDEQVISATPQESTKKCYDPIESGKGKNFNPMQNCKETTSRLETTLPNTKNELDSEKSKIMNSCVVTNSSNQIKTDLKGNNSIKFEGSIYKQNLLTLPSNNYSSQAQIIANKNLSPKITVYKILQSTGDMSKWNSAVDSKEQKIHILNRPFDGQLPKRLKLEQVNFKTISPNMKIAKENQIYKPVQTAFIRYGKIIPSSSVIKLEYRKLPNPPVSS